MPAGNVSAPAGPILTLLDGGPLARCLRAIEGRLDLAFPRTVFNRDRVPPTMSTELWRDFSGRAPFVGIGWVSWPRGQSAGVRTYRGDAHFLLFLIAQNRRDWLLTGDRGSPGILGMATVAIAYLDGWTIPGIGSCRVLEAGALEAAEWVTDDIAVCGVTVRVEGVSLFDGGLQPQIAEFLELGVTWNVGDVEQVDTVVEVRG